METVYNIEEARNGIEQSAIEPSDHEGHIKLANVYATCATFWDENKIQEFSNPASWRVVKRNTDDDAEEVVFTVRGVIHTKELPPINKKPRIPAHKYRFIRQGVSLTGLGTPTFTRAFQAIQIIHSHFDRHFQEGALEKQSESDELCIWNRYLTPAHEAKGMQTIPFLPGVDPNGTLRNMAQEDTNYPYVHTEDNQVHYFSARRDNEGDYMYERTEPQMFRVGDLVEAQLSFVVIPIKGGHRKMLTVLRSLALIKGNFIKMETKHEVEDVPTPKATTIKRKAGYCNVVEEKRMRLDDMFLEPQSPDC
ncbi:hypothetical protein BGW80DRAFT_1462135 [Lactifluus volemus]|nr:hypothetical protein BGW80DRAFT_1462135 [Lactifluus volemus]